MSSSIASKAAASGASPGKAGEDGSISDFAVDDEGRPLRDLQRVKVGGARPYSRFDLRRTRAFEQIRLVEPARLRTNLGRDFPLVSRFSVAQHSGGQRQSHAVIGRSQVSRCFRDEVAHRIFRRPGLEPLRVQHER